MRREINAKQIKALALDLDGTALLPDNTLGERTLACLRKLMERGIQIIICTGRAVEAAEPYRAAMEAEGPMVFFNGAEVVDVPSGKIVSSDLVELDIVDYGIDVARSLNVHYQIYLPPGAKVTGVDPGKWEALLVERLSPEAKMYGKHTGIRPIPINLKEVVAAPGLAGCVKAMFIAEPTLHETIRKRMLDRFGSRIYIARTFPMFLEVMHSGVSKGAGLISALRRRGIKPEETLALGDEENDLLMFSAAGFCAAPANARENVKKAANRIFGSNTEEGLAAFLENEFSL